MFVLLTARGCGHCEHFRGNGEIDNGKAFMTKDYIMSILKHNVKFYNIHYNSMNGLNIDINTISKMELIDGKIEQNIFYAKNNTMHHKQKRFDKKTSFDIDKEFNWTKFVKTKIPNNLQGYTYYFPCFGMFNIKNWNDSITSNSPLMGMLNLGFTVEDNTGKLFLYKDGNYLEKQKFSSHELLTKVVNKEIKFEPIKIKDLLNGRVLTNTPEDRKKVEESKVEKIKTEPKVEQSKVENNKMLIMQY